VEKFFKHMPGQQPRCWGHKNPHTTQEKKAYYSSIEFVRAKRRPTNLADAWDDQFIGMQKGWKWKSKKRKQWE